MVEMRVSPLVRITFSYLLLGVSEVSGSLLTWSGAPFDWIGEEPHFWSFELWRLRYWALFSSLSVLFWIICWYGLRKRIPRIALGALAGALAVTVESLTSIWYWHQLPWTQASILGWSYFPRYYSEHLICWAVVLLTGLVIWYFWCRRWQAQRVVPSGRRED
jgi:hypothetical protein